MKRNKRFLGYIIGSILVGVFITAMIAGRLYLDVWLTRYVNQVLNRIPGYEGSIGDVDVALYRGAYRIHQLKVYKKNGNISIPFIDIETVDLSIQWSALFHGRIVSDVDVTRPVINFAINPEGTVAQTGVDTDWIKPIKNLMPIDINYVKFREGELTYQDFSMRPKVNIYIYHMSGEIRNLRNVVDESQPLPSTLIIQGDSIGKGRLEIKGKMNILKEVPDMDLYTQLEQVNLAALSNYSNAYAAIDIKEGTLNLYSELSVKDNRVSGYIKPIATHVSLIDLRKSANPLKLAWESAVAVVVRVFTNLPKDQFATKIPLEGNLQNVDSNIWVTVAGIIGNAFISALNKGFDNTLPGSRP